MRKVKGGVLLSVSLIAGMLFVQNTAAQCLKDTDCKGDRVCVNGQCVDMTQAPAEVQSEPVATEPVVEQPVESPVATLSESREPVVAERVVAREKSGRSGVGLEIGFDLGYGFPLARDFQDPDGGGVASNTKSDETGYTEYKDVYGSLGNGLKVDLDLAYYFTRGIGIYFASGISTLGGIHTRSEYNSSTSKGIYKMNVWSTYIPVNIGLKAHGNIGIAEPYVFLAPGVYFPIVMGDSKSTFSSSTISDESTMKLSMKFTPGFGFSGGMGTCLRFSKVVGMRIELAPTYAFARLNEIEVKVTEDGTTNTYTTIYKQNEEDLPADVTTGTHQTDYEHGGPMYSFSSFALKIGMSFAF